MSEVTSVNGQTGAVVLTPADVEAVPDSSLGVAGGVATLGGSGKLPEAQLPSSVVSGSAGATHTPAEQGNAQANIGVVSEGYIRPLQSAATVAQQEVFCNGEGKKLSAFYSSISNAQVDYPFATSLEQRLDWAITQKAANLLPTSGSPIGGKIAMPPRGSLMTADMLSLNQCVAFESEGGGMYSFKITPTSDFGSYSTSPAIIRAAGPSPYTVAAFLTKGIQINAANVPSSVKYAIQLQRPYDLTRLERILFNNMPYTLQAIWAGPNPSLESGRGEFMVLDHISAMLQSYTPTSIGALSGALTAGTTISSITLSSGLASTLPAGNILVESAAGGPHGQVFYTTGAASGATTIPVESSDDFPSLVPIYSFSAGSIVTPIGVPLFHFEEIIETRLRAMRVQGEVAPGGPYWSIGYNFINCRSIKGDIEAHGIPMGMVWQVNEAEWMQAGQAGYFDAPVMEGVTYPATIMGTSSVKAASVYWLNQRSMDSNEAYPYNATGTVQLYQVQNSVIDVSNNTNPTTVYGDSTVIGCEITVNALASASVSAGVGVVKSRTGQMRIYNDDSTKTICNVIAAPGGQSNYYYAAEASGGSLVFGIDEKGQAHVIPTQAELSGTTAGKAKSSQPFVGGTYKRFLVYLEGYKNASGTAQTIAFPVAFQKEPLILSQPASFGATVSTTTLTLPTAMGAAVTGWIVVEGY